MAAAPLACVHVGAHFSCTVICRALPSQARRCLSTVASMAQMLVNLASLNFRHYCSKLGKVNSQATTSGRLSAPVCAQSKCSMPQCWQSCSRQHFGQGTSACAGSSAFPHQLVASRSCDGEAKTNNWTQPAAAQATCLQDCCPARFSRRPSLPSSSRKFMCGSSSATDCVRACCASLKCGAQRATHKLRLTKLR